ALELEEVAATEEAGEGPSHANSGAQVAEGDDDYVQGEDSDASPSI
ncbi:hypothetical protein A2U01_0075216, partial [Trifolium medium]|nr:hypothetical protein [Trifolium medium]